MNASIIAVVSFALLIAAYRFYGGFLRKKIFQIDYNKKSPAEEKNDGVEYVPTSRWILFGHQFASIAGLGPIVGPAIAVIWGWAPALLWVVLGSIFIGGVHDFGSLAASLLNVNAVVNAPVGMRYVFISKSLKARFLKPVLIFLLRIFLISHSQQDSLD